MEEAKQKQLRVSRVNPLIRIPAKLFNNIDGRKRRIPIIVVSDKNGCTITVDRARL